MNFLSTFCSLLGGVVTPVVLFLTFAFLLPHINLSGILNPKKFIKSICDMPEGSKTSPFSALSLALAGTLGVGNITGVASALICGGPGAIFWMWTGAIVSLAVKYAAVYLAILFRGRKNGSWFGGAMYYIRDGLSSKLPGGFSATLASLFAVLCCLNSLITGNLIQSNSAASVVTDEHRLICGFALGALVFLSILFGTHRIEKITSTVIPLLTAIYILISLYIIVGNLSDIPGIISDIFSSAFSFKAVGGGAVGFSVREALRFGIMRGIFSNEAGCGTSPTAHASAETKSPHNQASLGIVEVAFDTLILCTLTAFVLLIADKKYSIIPWLTDADNAVVSLEAFRSLTSDAVYYILAVSVIMFAYATIIAQIYYGYSAIKYLTDKKLPLYIYYALSVITAVVGSKVTPPVMWMLADLIIGTMTVINCLTLISLRKRCHPQLRQ